MEKSISQSLISVHHNSALNSNCASTWFRCPSLISLNQISLIISRHHLIQIVNYLLISRLAFPQSITDRQCRASVSFQISPAKVSLHRLFVKKFPTKLFDSLVSLSNSFQGLSSRFALSSCNSSKSSTTPHLPPTPSTLPRKFSSTMTTLPPRLIPSQLPSSLR